MTSDGSATAVTADRLVAHSVIATTVHGVATLDDVAEIALQLPEVSEGERDGKRNWAVAGKGFAWERSFSKADIKSFGDEPPPTARSLPCGWTISARRRPCWREQKGFFTIPHFNGYAAVLIQLKIVGKRALREALIDGWLACAPSARRRVRRPHDAGRRN